MGHNVQSQVGISLSDVYDVRGGQAPIERLLTTEVPVVHEMGSTIFAERFQQTIRRRSTGDIAQSTAIGDVITDLPAGPWMLHGLTVLSDASARLSNLAILARDPRAAREEILWVWNSVVGTFISNIRIQEEGAGISQLEVLIPGVGSGPFLPRLMSSSQSRQFVSEIAIRGLTTAFGAGTVETILLLHISLTHQGDISNHGLPIPSW